jgi:activator of HSP90 ATPase
LAIVFKLPGSKMVLHNPNNWHWVNKDVSEWARDYLGRTLTTISAEQDGASAKIDRINSMDGDVDVSQRKGKVITLFDVRLGMEWKGTLRHIRWTSGRSWASCREDQGRWGCRRDHHDSGSGS